MTEKLEEYFGEGFKTELDRYRRIVVTPDPEPIIKKFVEEHERETVFKARDKSELFYDFVLTRYIPRNKKFRETYGLNRSYFHENIGLSLIQLFTPCEDSKLFSLIKTLVDNGPSEERISEFMEKLKHNAYCEETNRNFATQVVTYEELEQFANRSSRRHFDLQLTNDPKSVVTADRNPFIYHNLDSTTVTMYGPNNMPIIQLKLEPDLMRGF